MRKFYSLLFILVFFTVPTLSHATTPFIDTGWYSASLEINTESLPLGIILENGSYLKNTTSEPFYITEKLNAPFDADKAAGITYQHPVNYKYPETGLPSNYRPFVRIKKGEVSYWDYGWNETTSSENIGYLISSEAFFKEYYSPTGRFPQGLPGYSIIESKQIYGENRPNDISIPDPQNISVTAYFKGTEVLITGKIKYSLSQSYSPTYSPSNEWGGDMSHKTFSDIIFNPNSIIILGFVILLVVITFLYLIIKRKKENITPPGQNNAL